MDKKELRRKYKDIRSAIIDKEARGIEMVKCLLSHPLVVKSKIISLFVSFGDEIDTHRLLEELINLGKRVVVPCISEDDNMVMKEISGLSDLVSRDKYGIEVVSSKNKTIDKLSIDLVIVPGLAFDKNGNRLGYGKGYYDRYLRESGIKTLGIGFKEQFADTLPFDNNDVKMDELLLF